MSIDISTPEFDEIANIFWRLGVMQSPSQLQGYLLGRLSAGDELEPSRWLELAAAYIEAVEAPNSEESTILTNFYQATGSALVSEDMTLTLFLPDDAAEISLRIDSIGQWCQGFLAGFAAAGKVIQRLRGKQDYSKDVSEALTDMAAISQVTLGDEESDLEQSEQDIFELIEYLRLAAITVYMECHHKADTGQESEGDSSDAKSKSSPLGGNPSHLFTDPNKRLH